jgi:hypothetical protein
MKWGAQGRAATREIWIGLLMLAFCSSVGAAEWVIVHATPEGDRYYYDASKLAIQGNEITYWKKVAFKSPYSYKDQQVASALYRERIDCTEHTVKPLAHIVHGVSGAVIEQVTTNEVETAAIIPETIGDVFELTLCALVKKREEEPHKPPAEMNKATESEKRPIVPQPGNGSEPPLPGTL